MNTQKSKEELVRLAWISALRREGHRQCEGNLIEGAKVCAIGLLGLIAGIDFESTETDEYDIGAVAGLSESQSEDVIALNDGGSVSREDERGRWYLLRMPKSTFAQIADVIEGWFK